MNNFQMLLMENVLLTPKSRKQTPEIVSVLNGERVLFM